MANQRATNQINQLQKRVSNLACGFSLDELPESAVRLMHAAETILSNLLCEIQETFLPSLESKEDYCQDVTLPATITDPVMTINCDCNLSTIPHSQYHPILSSSSTTTVTWTTTTNPSAIATLPLSLIHI